MNNYRKVYIYIICLCLLLAPCAYAIPSKFDYDISKYQEYYLLNSHIIIAKGDHIIYEKEIGFADLETKRNFSDNLHWPVASLSKQITAATILLFNEQEKLDLHKPILNYLTESNPIWKGKIPTWAREVSTHHLLTHSSGIEDCEKVNLENMALMKDEDIIPNIISAIKEKPLRFKPGSKFEYNNTGYLLLSAIVKEFSKEKSFSGFLKRRIFEPLHLHQTHMLSAMEEINFIKHPNTNNEFPSRYAADIDDKYSRLNIVRDTKYKAPLRGGVAVISTANDLLKWNNALYGGKLLNKKSLDMMTTPHIKSCDAKMKCERYGYGLYIENIKGQIIYQHNGWINGIRTHLSYNPKSKISVIMLSNLSPAEDQIDNAQELQAISFVKLGLALQKRALE